MSGNIYKMGIDVGSTTAKIVVAGKATDVKFSEYRRHNGKIVQTLLEILQTVRTQFKNHSFKLSLTGSAGMGVAEKCDLPFVQELLATARYTGEVYPSVHTLIDIGGEDSKIIFFKNGAGNDIRMNGSCAGGTGAFIDQMATLMNITLDKFNELAAGSRNIFTVASRCGVFAKTDVQNLLSRRISENDIAASVFHSVAVQIKNSLLRGYNSVPMIAFAGGPLTFMPGLKTALMKEFNLEQEQVTDITKPEFLPAIGAAHWSQTTDFNITIDKLIDKIHCADRAVTVSTSQTVPPLFRNRQEYLDWEREKTSTKAPRTDLLSIAGKKCYLGVDSGSTTTKIVLIDESGKIAFDFYKNNSSDFVGVVREGLDCLQTMEAGLGMKLQIAGSVVTGYGEDLIRSAFGFDRGIVETLAHYRAARQFNPEVSFILDIGGQDIKAIKIKNGEIEHIEINEACSSGGGSFIENFANTLDYSVGDFSRSACESTNPCDLGPRCTVFMNSKVKQSFREGASIDDISAGLAYSVVRNCLNKVLKIYDTSVLGDNIVVQGGTFRNPAVLRAFELILERPVTRPDISELMGAYGAALTAMDLKDQSANIRTLDSFNKSSVFDCKEINCRGCDNNCSVNKLIFENKNEYFTGNRCENIYTNSRTDRKKGFNLVEYKYNLLFDRSRKPATGKALMRIGIPRVLNMFENFPFWTALLVECGFEIVLSDKSSEKQYERGSGTIMSDNICFPARLVHGHIMDLIDKKVDRIFYPMVTFETKEFEETSNSFNCPVVSGYPEVIRSSINTEREYSIPFDEPNITFKDIKLLKRSCFQYLKQFDIDYITFRKAFSLAIKEQQIFSNQLKSKASEIISNAKSENRKFIVIAQRPYHIDQLINHHIPDIITSFGIDIITDDSIAYDVDDKVGNLRVLSQWEYPNRIFEAAAWVGKNRNAELVQLNSFGCGPDTIAIDETKEILESYGKNHTVIRIDEHTSIQSVKLRIRSLLESLEINNNKIQLKGSGDRITTAPFLKSDKYRTILMPYFSEFHSAYLAAPFESSGYKVELLPPPDEESIRLGLKYVNNEICYPATLVIGDAIKALQSGRYDLSKTAVGMSQTGGQCRASNYLSLFKTALVLAPT